MKTNPFADPGKLMIEARAAMQQGRVEQAEALLQQVVHVMPQNAQAHFALGTMSASRGDLVTAIERMREAVKIEPRFTIAITWLALFTMQMRDFKQAERYATRALQQDPRNPQCLKVLAQCQLADEDYAAALELFGQSIELQPDDPQAHFARGTVLRKLHRLAEALASFQEAARLSPDAAGHVEVAELQAFLGRNAESVESCKRALEVEPSSFRANFLLARTLTDEGSLSEAEPYWNLAEKNEPVPGQTRLEKSMRLATLGRFEEAEHEAERAITIDPARGRPYYVLFASRKVTENDRSRIDQMERLLTRSTTLDADRAELLYALGKAFDNLGDYERAIRHFDEANSLQHRLLFGDRPFDREQLRRSVDSQLAMLDRAALSDVGGETPDLPLFVLGMPRSGTTLVDQMLSCHPQVGSVGEQSFWLDYERTVIDYERRTIHAAEADRLKKLYTDLLTSLSPGYSQVVDKNPANVVVAGLLHTLFPASRIICTRRHAVDTALSIWMTQMHTEAPFVCDRDNIVFAYKQCLRLMDHWKQAMPPSRYLEVQYETLTEDPDRKSRDMVEFCGLEWSDECIHPERNTRLIRTPSFWQARQPVYRTSVDRWRRYEQWLGPFEELVGL